MTDTAVTTSPHVFRSPPEVFKRYGISSSTVDRWIKAGLFPKPIKFGSRRRWLEADLLAWEASQAKEPT